MAGTALTIPDGDYELSLRGKSDWGGVAFAQLAFAFGVSRNVEVWFDALGIVDGEGVFPFAGGGVKVVVHRGRRYQVSVGGGLRLPGLVHAVAAVTGCFDQRCFVVGTLSGGGAAAEGPVGFASAGLVVGASWLRAFLEVDVFTDKLDAGTFGVGGLRVGSVGGAFEVGYGAVLGEGTPTHGWWLGARLRL